MVGHLACAVGCEHKEYLMFFHHQPIFSNTNGRRAIDKKIPMTRYEAKCVKPTITAHFQCTRIW